MRRFSRSREHDSTSTVNQCQCSSERTRRGKESKGKDKGKGNDIKGKDKAKDVKNESSKKAKSDDRRKCFYCNKTGHVRAECRKRLKDFAEAEEKPVAASATSTRHSSGRAVTVQETLVNVCHSHALCDEADVSFPIVSIGEASQQGNWFVFGPGCQAMLPGSSGEFLRTCVKDPNAAKLEKHREVYWLPCSATEHTDGVQLCPNPRAARLAVEAPPISVPDPDATPMQLEESEETRRPKHRALPANVSFFSPCTIFSFYNFSFYNFSPHTFFLLIQFFSPHTFFLLIHFFPHTIFSSYIFSSYNLSPCIFLLTHFS